MSSAEALVQLLVLSLLTHVFDICVEASYDHPCC